MMGKLELQYEIMNDESKDETGNYVPNYDKLIEEAPNETMRNEWIRCRELLMKNEHRGSCGFAFSCVFMIKRNDGKYHIYQTPCVHNEAELFDEIMKFYLNK